jgi:hypothetical protein
MQKLKQEFLSRKKRALLCKKANKESWGLCQSCNTITENNYVKFQSIPFSCYGDTSLHTKTLPQGRLHRQMGDCISSNIYEKSS